MLRRACSAFRDGVRENSLDGDSLDRLHPAALIALPTPLRRIILYKFPK